MTPHRSSGDAAPLESEDQDGSRPSSLIHNDVFGDEFALDPLDVPYGFEPPSEEYEDPFADHLRQVDDASHPRSSPNIPDESPSVASEESPSHLKSDIERAVLADGVGEATTRVLRRARSISGRSNATDHERSPHRRHSSSLDFAVARSISPYRGATHPSYAYDMYAQAVGVSRSQSVATSSTHRVPDRASFTAPRGPAHPYTMYPQNTLGEDLASPSIPVGFLGLGQHHQRPGGTSEDDVQDIIGSDGHAEQLPAYSRYPDAVQAKEQLPSHVGGDIAGAPILNGEQTPVSAAVENQAEPPQDQVSAAEAAESQDITTNGLGVNNSEKVSDRWAENGPKRVCCGLLPRWAIVMLVITIVLAAVIGGVIGGSIASSSGKRQARYDAAVAIISASTTITRPTSTMTQIDASPLTSVPSNLPPLPCGTYAVTIETPQESSNACLGDTAQANAWDCTVPMGTLQLQVTQGQGHAPNELRLMLSEDGENAPIMYGSQPPVISQPQQLSMFEDLEDHGLGPAWFFQQAYDKIVIVRQDDFLAGKILDQAPSNSFSIKERSEPAIGFGSAAELYPRNRGGVALPGEQPWYCFWNHTLLEGFIYVTQNVSAASSSSVSVPSTTSTSLSFKARKTSTPKPSAQPIPAYPKQVKVGELRTKPTAPDYIAPYCQQMQILNDGSAGLVINTATQGPNIVPLNETTPSYQKGKNSGSGSGRRERRALKSSSTDRLATIKKRNFYTDSCHCEWMDRLS